MFSNLERDSLRITPGNIWVVNLEEWLRSDQGVKVLELSLALSLLEIFKNCNRNLLLVPFFCVVLFWQQQCNGQPLMAPERWRTRYSAHHDTQWPTSSHEQTSARVTVVRCLLRSWCGMCNPCESMRKYDLEVYSNFKSQSIDCSLHLPDTDYTCKKQFFHSLDCCSGRGQLPGSIHAVSSVSKAPTNRGFSNTMLLSWQDSQLEAIIKLNCKVCVTVREMQRQVMRDIPVPCLESRFLYQLSN